MGNKPICVPFTSAALYREYGAHPAQDRQYLSELLKQAPELFPHDMDQGFPLYDAYASVKQDVIVRRMKGKATGAVFSLRPSFVMPYMIGRTDAVEKALSLRPWGGRLTPWRMSVAAMPCAGIAPGWPAAARRLWAPRGQTRQRCPALWWPMSS
jgi:hypothetical protein